MHNNKQLNQRMSIYRPGLLQGHNQVSNDTKVAKKSHKFRHFVIFLVLLTLFGGVIYSIKGSSKIVSYQIGSSSLKSDSSTPIKTAVNKCIGNTQSQEVVVILSKQHLWACNYQTSVFNSAVVTGYTGSASDITAVGTYHIFNKYTNLNLTGKDDMGSWKVHVSYWMPYLFNQYGAYGLHDATWRTQNEFGHINTATENASHGCVELPLATAKWLYYWVNIGTPVSIRAT